MAGTATVSGLTLSVPVVEADLTDVFEHLDLHSAVPMIAEAQHIQRSKADTLISSTPHATGTGRRLQGGFDIGSALTTLSADIKGLGSYVDTAAALAEAAAAELDQGDFSQGSQRQLSDGEWNYDNSSSGPQCQFPVSDVLRQSSPADASTVTGTCQRCFAHLDLTAVTQITIRSGQLVNLTAVLEGDATFQASLDLQLSGSSELRTNATVHKLVIGPVPMAIALLQMSVTVKVPIKLGVDAQLAGSVSVTADMAATVSLRSGFVTLPSGSSNTTAFVNSLDVKPSGSGVSLNKLDGSATVRFFLMPIPTADFTYVGGPTVGLKTYLEGVIASAEDSTKAGCSQASLTTNVGLDATIGADININILGATLWKKKFESQPVFSLHKHLGAQHCVELSGTGR